MNTNLTIREFRENDLSVYRALRLEALRESPDAFGSTYQAEASRQDWDSRLAGAVHAPSVRLILAEVGSVPAGLAMGKIWPESPEAVHVYQMWVAPQFRTRGIGGQLLDDLVSWAKQHAVLAMVLGVTCGNGPARRLYERRGFIPVGEPTSLRPGSQLEAQEMRLEVLTRGDETDVIAATTNKEPPC